MEKIIIASESFSHKGKHFYIDYRQAVNQCHFLSLACVDEHQANRRFFLRVFQQSFFIDNLQVMNERWIDVGRSICTFAKHETKS